MSSFFKIGGIEAIDVNFCVFFDPHWTF